MPKSVPKLNMHLPIVFFLHFAFATLTAWGSKPAAAAISAAVNTAYNLNVRNVETQSQPIKPQKIDIDANSLPLVLHFKSQSSRLKIMQTHKGNEGEMHRSISQDDPDILMHEVRKPILQVIREKIFPYRKLVQEISPVVEHIETIVTGSKDRSNNAVDNLFQLKNKQPATAQSQIHQMVNSPPPFDDGPSFPDDNYIRNQLSQQMNRDEGARNGRDMQENNNGEDGNAFNRWMQPFRNEDTSGQPMGPSRNF